VIPAMTDPLGRSWEQPPASEILVDESHAVMTNTTLLRLHAYDHSIPTGVYTGKMWRRREASGHLLCWYGPSEKPNECSINYRPVLLV